MGEIGGQSWSWTPGKRVGPFIFGESVPDLLARVALVRVEAGPGEYWETFDVPGTQSSVIAENGVVASISCHESLVYSDAEIIGLTASQARALFGPEDEMKPAGPWIAMYYTALGLTLWLTDGVAESATCDALPASPEKHVSVHV